VSVVESFVELLVWKLNSLAELEFDSNYELFDMSVGERNVSLVSVHNSIAKIYSTLVESRDLKMEMERKIEGYQDENERIKLGMPFLLNSDNKSTGVEGTVSVVESFVELLVWKLNSLVKLEFDSNYEHFDISIGERNVSLVSVHDAIAKIYSILVESRELKGALEQKIGGYQSEIARIMLGMFLFTNIKIKMRLGMKASIVSWS
jgi:hypothetical protein